MQFKKHFSSNLQNLSVKKTQILQPPPNQIINPSSTMAANYFPNQQHSNYELDDSYPSNKENYKENYNNNNVEHFAGLKDTRRYVSMDKNGSSPQLTFNKIRRNVIQMQREDEIGEDLHYRKLFQPIQTNRNLGKQNCMDSNQNKLFLTQKHVRLGSMVFGNIIKREENVKKEVIRESKSFDRLSHLKTQNSQVLQCMNSDGQEAKYKVVRHEEEQGSILYYCFNCAISLVKQGFMIEQLSQQDKNRVRPRFSSVMSRSDFQQKRQMENSRFSQKRPLILPQKVKIGEQVKCKIIMKLNKLKVTKEEFNKNVDNHLENIDYFYNSLTSFIDQQRVNDRQEILRIKNMRKNQPENYQNRLSSCLGTIDYMMKNMQGISSEYNRQVEDLLISQHNYPKFRTNIDPLQGFQTRIDNFASYFEKNLKLSIVEDCQIQKSRSRQTSHIQQSTQRSHHLRFSFEQALQQSNWRSPQHNKIATLEQENQSQFQDSMPVVQRRQNAFRNLFPDQMDDEQLTKIRQSPVFKAF